ncbi:hypothetical protein MMC34_000196 [Xylographa carneopallida]|nr:hypothetical protein [Xylographa carneopallida]
MIVIDCEDYCVICCYQTADRGGCVSGRPPSQDRRPWHGPGATLTLNLPHPSLSPNHSQIPTPSATATAPPIDILLVRSFQDTLEDQMFAHAVPSAPTVSTSTPPASPTGPSRPSRLRGLSYLRNYTQQHLSLHSQQPASPPLPRNSLLRSISYPTPTQQPTSPSSEPSGHSLLDNNSNNPDQTTEEASGAGDTETAGASVDMARKRSGSSQVGSQAIPTRRGQSVPPASLNTDTRNLSRLARTVSSNEPNATTTPLPAHGGASESSNLSGLPQDQMPTIKFIPHQDPRSGKPSLSFPTTSRTLPHEDCVIRVGRYSERDGQPNPPPNQPSSAPVGFKSKVVSRRHCEFWCSQGQWYIKDVKSSSGTFLNHIRLSQPSVESRPFPVNDGDVVQLGIDFRGGEEMIFRCVKIRIECNRAWQKSLNNFKYVFEDIDVLVH